MSKRVNIEIVSDLTLMPIPPDEVRSRDWTINGRAYHLDLTPPEATKFDESQQFWIDASSPAQGNDRASSGASGSKKVHNKGTVKWALAHGFEEVNQRGRVQQYIVDAFAAAKARGEV